MIRIGHALGIAAFALALAPPARARDTVRVRGTIEHVDGQCAAPAKGIIRGICARAAP